MYYHTIIDVDEQGVGTVIKGDLELNTGVFINSKRQLAPRSGATRDAIVSVYTGFRSAAINTVAFNPATEELDITFQKTGYSGYATKPRTYRYSNVPMSQVMRLLVAESLGGYFNRYLRNQYRNRQLA